MTFTTHPFDLQVCSLSEASSRRRCRSISRSTRPIPEHESRDATGNDIEFPSLAFLLDSYQPVIIFSALVLRLREAWRVCGTRFTSITARAPVQPSFPPLLSLPLPPFSSSPPQPRASKKTPFLPSLPSHSLTHSHTSLKMSYPS